MALKSNISLRNFFIFNSTYEKKEGDEEKKILFYHPSEIETDTKIKDVGLSEAIISFTGTFDEENDIQSLHTEKTNQLFYEAEKNFYMIMTINVPIETKTENKEESLEYRNNEVHDTIFRSVLQQTYRMFRLFAGTFAMNLIGETEDEKISNLKSKLNTFYSKYLPTIKLQSCDIIDVIRSVPYLPLSKFEFLRVHNFVNTIEATFPRVKNSIFLYNEQLIWSEVNPSDLYSIYEYLVSTLLPKAIQTELQSGAVPLNHSIDESQRYGIFVTGPDSFESCAKVPKIYMGNPEELTSSFLVVYRSLNATICLFVDDIDPIEDDFYQELHSFMGPQLSSIASEIAETYLKYTQSQKPTNGEESKEMASRFLYINELTLRHTGTIYLDNRRPKNAAIPREVMNVIADLHDRQEHTDKGLSSENIVKSVSDFWVVKRTSNWRHFYVIINNSKATMLDISNEVDKLFDQQVTNVFFAK